MADRVLINGQTINLFPSHTNDCNSLYDHMLNKVVIMQFVYHTTQVLYMEPHLLGSSWVSREESPVYVPSVSQIRVVRVLGGEAEHLLN